MTQFLPTLESVQSHEVPDWFHDAKFGIFVHWGMSSIPAFAPTDDDYDDTMDGKLRLFEQSPYAEWYLNGMRMPGSRTAKWHAEHYGADTPYEVFREPFEKDLAKCDPSVWAKLAAKAGAKYLVQVTKHHDGYCLWPTDTDNPNKPGWWSKRDIVGETAAAVRAEGLRYGSYYSVGLDWTFNEQLLGNFADLILAIPETEDYRLYAEAHVRELIERVAPDVLWNDIGYPTGESIWQIMADYYNAVPGGVINDRWQQMGSMRELLADPATYNAIVDAANKAQEEQSGGGVEPPLPPHCDFRTPEYTHYDAIQGKKWESTRGIGKSFGYRTNEPEDCILKLDELVTSFVDIVSKNGNLLLNIGPKSDGSVPDYQVALLEQMGDWLAVNGEGIYGTRPWERAEGETDQGIPVRFTQKNGKLYAFLIGTPKSQTITLKNVKGQSCQWLGKGAVKSNSQGENLEITVPDNLSEAPTHCIEITI